MQSLTRLGLQSRPFRLTFPTASVTTSWSPLSPPASSFPPCWSNPNYLACPESVLALSRGTLDLPFQNPPLLGHLIVPFIAVEMSLLRNLPCPSSKEVSDAPSNYLLWIPYFSQVLEMSVGLFFSSWRCILTDSRSILFPQQLALCLA